MARAVSMFHGRASTDKGGFQRRCNGTIRNNSEQGDFSSEKQVMSLSDFSRGHAHVFVGVGKISGMELLRPPRTRAGASWLLWLIFFLGQILSSSQHGAGFHSQRKLRQRPAVVGMCQCPSAEAVGVIFRLRGGGSVDPRTGFRAPINPLTGRHSCPSFDEVVKAEGADAFFNEAEIKALKAFYGKGANSEVPQELLTELRHKISHRRDKISRALMLGGAMSESEEPDQVPEAKEGGSKGKPKEPVLQRKRNMPSGLGLQKKGRIQEEGQFVAGDGARKRDAGVVGNERDGSTRSSSSSSTKIRATSPTSDTAEASVRIKATGHASSGAVPNLPSKTHVRDAAALKKQGKKEDLLQYNPSVTALMGDGQEEEEEDEMYLGWAQVRLAGTAGESVRVDVREHKGDVIALSPSGVVVGEVAKGTESEAMLKLLKHLAPPIKIEACASGKSGLEMLFTGPPSSAGALEKHFRSYGVTFKAPDQEATVGKLAAVDRDEEELAMANVVQGEGGSLADLLADQSLPEGMPQMAAPSSVKTPLLEHQRIALAWMVSREQSGRRPLFWVAHKDHFSGEAGWLNTITRTFSKAMPSSPRGGLLADEMGLGKTLAVISVIMRGLKAKDEVQDGDDKRNDGPTLIVCPLSVLYTWADQMEKHTDGSARILLYHGPQRPRLGVSFGSYDVVLTTYSVLASEYLPSGGTAKRSFDQDCLAPMHSIVWKRVVLDEAHVVSNRLTQQSRAVLALKARARWVVTGTPIQNRIEDLYPLMAFLKIHPLDDFHWFTRLVLKPMRDRDPAALMRIRKVLRVFCLRRTKDILMEGRGGKQSMSLKEKSIELRELWLSVREQRLYDQMAAHGRETVYGSGAGSKVGGNANSGFTQVLVMLLRLRQLCDHPTLVANSLSGTKLYQLGGTEPKPKKPSYVLLLSDEDDDEEAEEEGNGQGIRLQHHTIEELVSAVVDACESALSKKPPGEGGGALTAKDVWSALESTCCGMTITQAQRLIRPALAASAGNDAESIGPEGDDFWEEEVELELLADSIVESGMFEYRDEADDEDEDEFSSDGMREDRELWDSRFLSTKVKAVLDELHDIIQREGGEKAVVFSQFTSFLDVLGVAMRCEGIEFVRLDGSMMRQARVAAIETFHTRPATRVFLVSLKSGGMGLNLVAANHVLITDLWWNGAAEDQAMDRVHRVGQKRDVRVIRFVTRRTVEERILQLQNKKRSMIRGAMHHKLTADDVKMLFSTFED